MDTILINGATGRLGQAIYQYLRPHYHLISCHRNHSIIDALKEKRPDIIIDVTNANVISEFLILYQTLKIPTIVATSGIQPELAYTLTQQADYPLLIVPNLSLSFQSFVKSCISLASHAQSIEIIETHHQNKLDKPSGTSLFLAHTLKTSSIQSVRVPHYIAQHEVIFHHPHHCIQLTHQISDISEFLPGIKEVIHKLQHKKTPMVLFSDQ